MLSIELFHNDFFTVVSECILEKENETKRGSKEKELIYKCISQSHLAPVLFITHHSVVGSLQ